MTAIFWVVKLLTTGLGEAAGDFLALRNLVLAAVLGTAGFVISLVVQVRSDRFRVVPYWSAVLMVAVFGTMAADGVRKIFAVPYVVSTAVFAVILAAVFGLWRASEGTLSVHSITSRRRECFYWLTVVTTFALGTALGDLTATTVRLGFLSSAILFAVLIVLPAVGWARFGLNPVAAFWGAYVLTRPLGASLADWLGKDHSFGGGLGYGDGTVTLCGLGLFVLLVGGLALRGEQSAA